MKKTDDENLKAFLINVQRAKLERLSLLLAEYIRKHDYRFANELKDEEPKSVRWAIDTDSGLKFPIPGKMRLSDYRSRTFELNRYEMMLGKSYQE